MGSSIITTVTHIVILALYLFTLYTLFMVVNIPFINEKFKDFDVGQLKYLTIWNVISQAVFFLICMLNDIFGTNSINPKKRPFIRKFKDFYHASIGFPVSMFVGIMFWALMAVDRELVFPAALSVYIPSWLNHIMHTMIMVATVLEMLMAPRQYPKRKNGLLGVVGFMLVYLSWMHFIYFKSGVWPYPLFDVLTWPLRIAFYLSTLAIVIGLYFSGEALDRLIWGKTAKTVEKSSKKKK